MNLSAGRKYIAIPGPSVVPDKVLAAMHRAAPDIYASDLEDMVIKTLADLKTVAGTSGHAAIYIANGHGTWEACLSNTLSRGDRILTLSTGLFANAWGRVASDLGAEVECIEFGTSSPIDPAVVAARLTRDSSHTIKAVLVVQVDTASSVRNDIKALSKAMKETGHPELLMVDCVASLGCERFRMDDWGVDVMLAASQKGLMTPPGIGFLFFNERAKRIGRNANMRTRYWDWNTRVEPEEFYFRFCGTAPTHHLFGLRAALDMLLKDEGLDSAYERHARLAQAIWAAVQTWGMGSAIALNIENEAHRSHAVTTVCLGEKRSSELREWTASVAGVTLGIGLGMETPEDPESQRYFRMAHMGHVNAHMMLGMLAVVNSGLKALGIKHGEGAIEAAAKVCSGMTS